MVPVASSAYVRMGFLDESKITGLPLTSLIDRYSAAVISAYERNAADGTWSSNSSRGHRRDECSNRSWRPM